jgi:agmatinase/guanidinopropionase
MEFKPLRGREFPRFSAIKTFFRLPIASLDERFDVALFGIPFDGAVSYRPGCRFGPSALRDASSLGRGFHLNRGVALFDSLKIADVGDCSIVPIDIGQTYHLIENHVTEILRQKKRFVAVGGDHSTTLPVLRALHKKWGVPLNFVHFDAHLDTYPAAWGCEYHHGSFARHAVEEGLVNPQNMIQIGIRGPLAGGDDLDFIKAKGIRAITIEEIRRNGLWNVISTLPEFKGPTYLSFDIDCLDPAYAPGTGTPVVGGLTTFETQEILRGLKIENLVGADVVEISPPFDHAQITALAGVDTMFEILCLMAKKN